MPDPIMDPATIIVESKRPSPRMRSRGLSLAESAVSAISEGAQLTGLTALGSSMTVGGTDLLRNRPVRFKTIPTARTPHAIPRGTKSLSAVVTREMPNGIDEQAIVTHPTT